MWFTEEVSHQPLEIGLSVSRQRTEDDRQCGQQGQGASVIFRFLRVERQNQPKKTISAQLEEHPGQDHRTGCGRFGVRIRQPGVERPNGHFDGKSDGKGPKGDRLDCADRQTEQRAAQSRPLFEKHRDIERSRYHTDHLDSQQQTQGTGHGVDHKFKGGISSGLNSATSPDLAFAFLTAPLVDQEIHGDQPDLPENEKEQQIQAEKDAQHAGLE